MSAEANRVQTRAETLIGSSALQQTPGQNEPSRWTLLAALCGKVILSVSASWVVAVLALGLYILTALYAASSKFITRYHVIGRSPSNVLLMLRVLSELAGLMLGATIAAAFEKVKWTSVGYHSNKSGLPLTDYMILDPGTGVSGLSRMAIGLRGSGLSSRIKSAIRLTAMMIVPLLNIVIMGNVGTTAITFDKLDKAPQAYGYGLGNFNASLASLWVPITDLLFSANFMMFLSDNNRVVDLTSPTGREQCETSALNKNCKLRYYATGNIDTFAPSLLAAGHSEADAFLAENQQGYLLEFEDGSDKWQYHEKEECSVYGIPLAAWALCLKDSGSNEIQAAVAVCPGNIANKLLCQSDTSWISEPAFSTSLRTWHRRATVAYSRVNGTILMHRFNGSAPLIEAPVKAAELLMAFNISFKLGNSASPFASALAVLGIGNGTAGMPLYAWWFFHGIFEEAKEDNAARRRGIAGLQSLLSLPIYHCQVKGFAELRSLGYDNETAAGRIIFAAMPTADPDLQTPIFPAALRYDISVGRTTLIAYIVLGGVTLLLCFIAIAIGTLTESARRAKGATAFPILDFMTRCEIVKDGTEKVVSKQDFIRLGQAGKGVWTDEVTQMRVKLANANLDLQAPNPTPPRQRRTF